MADVATADPIIIPTKKRSKKPLKLKTLSQNESNIITGEISDPLLPPENSESLSQRKSPKIKKSSKTKKNQQPEPIITGAISQPSPVSETSAGKENSESLSKPKIKKSSKTRKNNKKPEPESVLEPVNETFSFEKEMQEMQKKLEKMTLEKQQAEEMLKLREQELESQNKEQEKVKIELKKLQKLKEFKPTMTLPSLKDKDQMKKKKSCPETKKPATPYIMWCKEHWPEVKKENPEAEFSEVANILGTKWKTLTPEEKKPYEEKYQIEKAVYSKFIGNEKRENEAMKLLEEEQKQKTAMELLEQYMQFKQEAEKDKKNKKEKDPLKPKRPESAYFLFMNERRAALIAENKSMVEIAKITGEEWKNMTENQKGRYEKVAKEKNEKYTREMEVYKQNKEDEAENAKKEEDEGLKVLKQEALQLLKKKEKAEIMIKKTKEKKNKKKEEKTNDPNKPKRPPSSFLLFSKETRKELSQEKVGMNNSQIVALISVKWKELSEEDKQKWNSEAAEAMEAYKKEMEDYNKNAMEITNNHD